jgi:hypothetical protein
MKYNYDHYFIQLPNGKYISATRAKCFAIDKDKPDKNQRWLWDDEQRTYAIRLAPTEEGKQTGNDHAAALKREERYGERTVLVDSDFETDGGETRRNEYIEPVSEIGNPSEEYEKRASCEALEDFLKTLCEADRLLWDYWRDGVAEKDIADKLGLKQRKSVYDRKKKLEAKIKGDANLKDFYGN